MSKNYFFRNKNLSNKYFLEHIRYDYKIVRGRIEHNTTLRRKLRMREKVEKEKKNTRRRERRFQHTYDVP